MRNITLAHAQDTASLDALDATLESPRALFLSPTERPADPGSLQNAWDAIDRQLHGLAQRTGFPSWQARRDEKLRLQAIGDRFVEDSFRRGHAITSPEPIRAAILTALDAEWAERHAAGEPPPRGDYNGLACDAASACYDTLQHRLSALRRDAAHGDPMARALLDRLDADLAERAAAYEARQQALYRQY
ncbi:MAG TPA: hypothetical protein VFS08_10580, partial [Gemmatimonadaceae bacterium]|nr:hypothetical protein [Gemmatimonadaceae bacterium]